MQKKLIALAVAGLIASPVFAQSSIVISGRVDMGYQQWTNDSTAATANEESTSRLNISGTEDLGSGMNAFFALEERFKIDSGTTDGGLRFKDKAWVGIGKNTIGSARFGRIGPSWDWMIGGGTSEAFGGDTIASVKRKGTLAVTKWDNGMYLQSAALGPVTLHAATALTEVAGGKKTPYSLGLNVTVGQFKMDVVYQHDTYKDGSLKTGLQDANWNSWVINPYYNFGVAEVFGTLFRSKGYNIAGVTTIDSDSKEVGGSIGARFPVGPGKILVEAGRYRQTNVVGDKLPALTQYSAGYWYDLSKRTTLMANVTYKHQNASTNALLVGVAAPTSGSPTGKTGFENGTKDSTTGIEFAIRHSF